LHSAGSTPDAAEPPTPNASTAVSRNASSRIRAAPTQRADAQPPSSLAPVWCRRRMHQQHVHRRRFEPFRSFSERLPTSGGNVRRSAACARELTAFERFTLEEIPGDGRGDLAERLSRPGLLFY
jgi:hypothetical protein